MRVEGIRQRRWKLVNYPDHGFEQLFDLRADPREKHDLARSAEQVGVLVELRQRLAALRAAAA